MLKELYFCRKCVCPLHSTTKTIFNHSCLAPIQQLNTHAESLLPDLQHRSVLPLREAVLQARAGELGRAQAERELQTGRLEKLAPGKKSDKLVIRKQIWR